MENKLDKLFRDKLENYSTRPSANAWERVKASTSKKNNTLVWAWRIAATITFMGVIGWFVYTQFSDQQELPMAQKNESKKESKKLEPVTKEIKPEEKARPTSEPNSVVKKSNLVPQPIVQQTVAKVEPEVNQQEEVRVTETVAVVETTAVPSTPTETRVETKTVKPMVIVYSLASVQPKQSVEPAKVKPLRKMIEFAQDVKGGETTLASVRDWKDHFFGFEEQEVVEKQNN